MSFRQDRTNPSTAISNWKGRSETPKGWPSTRVSTWMNGALFGGAPKHYWILALHVDSATTQTTGGGVDVDSDDNIYWGVTDQSGNNSTHYLIKLDILKLSNYIQGQDENFRRILGTIHLPKDNGKDIARLLLEGKMKMGSDGSI